MRREETSGQSPRPHTSFVRMPAIEVLIEVLAAGARATLSATSACARNGTCANVGGWAHDFVEPFLARMRTDWTGRGG